MSSETSPLKSSDRKQLISNRLINFLETEKKVNMLRKNSSKTDTEKEVCTLERSSDEKYPNKDAKDLDDSVVQITAACKEKTDTEMEVCSLERPSDEKYPNKDAKDLYDSVVQITAACKEKLSQLTFTANQFSRHSHRGKLTSEDFEKSRKFYGLCDDSEDSDSSNSDSDAKLSDDEDESISITCHGSLLKSNGKEK
ncbi:hypothetical protein TNCV_2072551 [Trichonephila clavipes]|nr:hypothetical protein TNCV_2072551 [Trichonephila clavipes]